MKAPAKLTRSLRVRGRREDGYHLIEAEMVTLDLGDEIEVYGELRPAGPADPVAVEVLDEIEWLGGPRPTLVRLADGADLVERALRAVGRCGRVRVHKRVPPGAGLGGGSADAAAVLRLARCRDLSLAAALGADVPFCLVGGRARVGGIGEVVEPLDHEPAVFLTVTPPVPVSTSAVYAAWDALGGPPGEHGNDLEAAALTVVPRLAWWRDLVREASGLTPRLAGSGGTWWVESGEDDLARARGRVEGAVEAEGECALVRISHSLPVVV